MHAEGGDRKAAVCGFLLNEIISGRIIKNVDLISLVWVMQTTKVKFT